AIDDQSELSDQVTSYSWDFNSDQIPDDTAATATYQFDTTGSHVVRLDVVGDNGCTSYAIDTINIYPTPLIPTFDYASDLFCESLEVTVNNTTDESGYDSLVTFHWQATGIDSVYEAHNPNFLFNNAGSKIVQVYSSIPGCASDTTYDTLMIYAPPTAEFLFNDACFGEMVVFENSSVGAASYEWAFGDGYNSTGTDPTHNYESVGNYETTLTAISAQGCETEYMAEVSVAGIPSVGFRHALICAGDSAIFQDTSSVVNDDLVAWQWYIEDSLVSSSRDLKYKFEQHGNYRIREVVQSATGCEVSYSKTVSILEIPTPSFSYEQVCNGEEFVFINPMPKTDYYQSHWIFDGEQIIMDTFRVTFDSAGVYDVGLSITNNNLCSVERFEQITVKKNPVIDFSVMDLCQNEVLQLEAAIVAYDDSVQTISWLADNEPLGVGSNVYVDFNEPGEHALSLMVQTKTGCVHELTKTILVSPEPVALFSASSDYGAVQDAFTFDNQGDSGKFVWYVDGAKRDTSESYSTSFSEAGIKTITLTVENEYGCQDSVWQQLLVVEPVINVSISEIELVAIDDRFGQLVVEVANLGNMPVEQLAFELEIEGAFNIRETFKTRINNGASNVFSLTSEIPIANADINAVCVSVSAATTYPDIDLFNNTQCLTIDPEVVFEAPYPNPASDELVVKAIIPDNSDVQIRLLNLSGHVVLQNSSEDLSGGLKSFVLDLREIESGLYFLTIDVNDESTTSRIAIK
ncbi:MAG: PKD domain-containing protein, partial [Cyclobacteriaceae bacterium]